MVVNDTAGLKTRRIVAIQYNVDLHGQEFDHRNRDVQTRKFSLRTRFWENFRDRSLV